MLSPCPRCGIGIDDDGDGNCATCARLDNWTAAHLKASTQYRTRATRATRAPRYPSYREEIGKPQVRWARLLIFEGSEDQLAWHKKQSVFTESRRMGNVTCQVISDGHDLEDLETMFPQLFSKETR